MSVSTGLAYPVDGEYVSVEVFRVVCMASVAMAGEVLCTEATVERVLPVQKACLRDIGLRDLRQFSEPQRLFQLMLSEPPSGAAVRGATMSGRMSGLDPYAQLTAAQEAVAVLVAQGLSNPQIAQRLSISRHTVETHMKHIFAKLGLHTRNQLAAMVAYHSTVGGSH